MNRKSLVLCAALSTAALAQDQPLVEAEIQSWSDQQLCESRNRIEVWAELERRGTFSRRELRAIKSEDLRTGISEDAVLCFMGAPESVVSPIGERGGDPIDAYIYPLDEEVMIVVHIRHHDGESTLIRAFTSTSSISEAPGRAATIPCARGRPNSTCHDSLGPSQPRTYPYP